MSRICDDLELGGYNDWYLPSRDELNALYQNLVLNDLGDCNTIPYWCFTELNADFAYIQYLDNGSQTQANKDNDYYLVRAVRAF